MKKSNPGKRTSNTGASWKPEGRFKAGASSRNAPVKRTRFKDSEGFNEGDRKKTYGARPVSESGDRFDKRKSTSSFDDKKKNFGSKPPYKSYRGTEGSEDKKKNFGSKPPYKSYRSTEGSDDKKKTFGSKPPYKSYRGAEGSEDKKKTFGSKPPYKTAGGRTVYDKRKPEAEGFERKKRAYPTKPPYKTNRNSEGPVNRKNEFEDRPSTKSFQTRSAEGNKGTIKTKKAYGTAETFSSRSTLKSFKEKEEKPTRSKRSFGENRDSVTGPSFAKKSEMKGYKPRIKPGEEEKNFRFAGPGAKGKSVKVNAIEPFESKIKSQSKERKTESELYAGAEIRLNRFLSNAGVSSRREADELIGAGLVTINGKVITELGTKVNSGDVVKFNGQKLAVEAKVYIVLNKPKDAITTSDDPEGRNTVMDLFEGKMKERIFPIGRLDRNTTGVLVLTNDGELANRLMHPKHEINKVYKATLNKNLKSTDLWTLANGVMLEDGMIKPDAISQDAKEKNVVGLEIHSGRNRIIHRMFEHLGYSVDRLDRVLYAGLEKGNLKRGEWREMSDKEIKALKRLVNLR